MARLFFAVWPDAPAAARLAKLAGELAVVSGGKPVDPAKVHLTLAFLGELSAGEAGVASRAAAGAASRAFTISLDCVGSFRAARVAWAGALDPQPELLALQADLARRLVDAGLTLEDRPYAPHATLARGIRRPVPRARIEPIAWTVDAFTLVRSESGTGRYVVVESFAGG